MFATAKENKLRHLDFLFKATRPELIRAGAVVLVFGIFGLMFNTQFGVFLDLSETRCMPEHVYLGYPRRDELERGDIVSFRASNRIMFDLMSGKRIAKIIAGVAGDYVTSNENGAFVNGVKVGERNPISLQNLNAKNKSPINMDRVLLPGELFLVGTLPRSFDSRYWGVASALSVDRLILPIF